MSEGKTPRLPGDEAKPLEGEQKDAWHRVMAAGDEIGEAARAGDSEALAAGLEKLGSVRLDHQAVLNALHLPDDAGEHADGLHRILRRIPDGWGRWIGCGPGWYGVLVRLDARLAQLDATYEVHQVKEKYGQLEYYFSAASASYDEMDVLVEVARKEAARTCELCGQPGRTHSTNGQPSGWLQTLCASCGKQRGFLALARKDAD